MDINRKIVLHSDRPPEVSVERDELILTLFSPDPEERGWALLNIGQEGCLICRRKSCISVKDGCIICGIFFFAVYLQRYRKSFCILVSLGSCTVKEWAAYILMSFPSSFVRIIRTEEGVLIYRFFSYLPASLSLNSFENKHLEQYWTKNDRFQTALFQSSLVASFYMPVAVTSGAIGRLGDTAILYPCVFCVWCKLKSD